MRGVTIKGGFNLDAGRLHAVCEVVSSQKDYMIRRVARYAVIDGIKELCLTFLLCYVMDVASQLFTWVLHISLISLQKFFLSLLGDLLIVYYIARHLPLFRIPFRSLSQTCLSHSCDTNGKDDNRNVMDYR